MSFNDTALDINHYMDMSCADDLAYAAEPRWKRRQQRLQQAPAAVAQAAAAAAAASSVSSNGNMLLYNVANQSGSTYSPSKAHLYASAGAASHLFASAGAAISAAAACSHALPIVNSALPKSPNAHDRFIGARMSQEDLEIARYKLLFGAASDENQAASSSSSAASCGDGMDDSMDLSDENGCASASSSSSYSAALEERMFNGRPVSGSKILKLSEKAPEPPRGAQNNLRVVFSQNRVGGGPMQASQKRVQGRHIPTTCDKILDAPGLNDDFYLKLLDWSTQNVVAIALGAAVYLWNAETGATTQLMQALGQDNYVTSVSFLDDGSFLAIGTNYNDVQIWDIQKQKCVRTMRGHTARVSSLSWNQYILSSGGRDGYIYNHDVRLQHHIVGSLKGHDQEVCGLKWSPDGSQLASGGNDNVLNVWDAALHSNTITEPRFRLTEHTAAVKALAWCPWQQHLLASGGGTADRKLCFWNTSSGSLVNSIDTRSQVCSIVWSKNDRELVSSHGFSQNQLIVWKYPSLAKVAELTGHTSRVLHMAQSPDGSTIVSAAGDETLRFWRIFSTPSEVASKAKAAQAASALSMRQLNIR